MSLNHPHRITLLGLLLAICFAFSPAADARVSDVYRVDFPGGTVAEYIELIRETIPDINIVLMPDANDVQIPSFRLHSWPGNEGVFFNVLEYVTRDSGPDELDVTWDGDMFFIRLEYPQPAEKSARQAQEERVHSYSLASIIVPDHVSADDILANIEQALEMAGETDPAPELRFHEQTNLLMVRGTRYAHSVVGNILSSMLQTATELRLTHDQKPPLVDAEQARKLHEAIGMLEEELTRRDQVIKELAKEVRELRSELVALLQRQQQ